ncbi:MAG: glycosyltransferase family 39 protein [Planctomycetes bacterium]|nr:glycosyltransferase family 39 protein [Planctomycetota bacterium]
MNVAELAVGRSRVALAVLACVAVTVVAFALRFRGLDHLLPHCVEPDGIYALQPQMIRSQDRDREYATYPLLVGYAVLAWPGSDAPPAADATLTAHLRFASREHFRARCVVAFLSALIAPATWWLARNFVGRGWATFAALLAATSLMHVNFSQQARPHAPVTAALALALCAALRARRTGKTSDWRLASAATMLPIGLLQTGVFALGPLFVAHFLRTGEKRARDHVRLLAPLVCVVVAVLAFYPELRPGSFGVATRTSGSRVVVGSHVFDWHWFDGSGFRVLLDGVWNNDPVLLALAGLGLVFGAVALLRRTASTPLAEVAIAAALFVPYLAVFGAYQWSLDRFATVLIPALAVLAACGARGALSLLFARLPTSPRIAAYTVAIVAALALPCYAANRLVRLRSQPDSLELAARWAGTHLHPRTQRIWLQPGVELPLPSSPEAIESGRAAYRSFTGFWWMKHQETVALARQRVFDVRVLPDLWDRFWDDIELAPEPTLASLGESVVLCAGFQRSGYGFKVGYLRAELERSGRRMWSLNPIPAARHDFTGLGYNNVDFLDDVLHANCVGPAVEVYAIERCE